MKKQGLTLIELLVVLAIVVGIAVASVPLSSHFTRKNLLLVRKDQLANAIKYARNQAIILDTSLVLSHLPETDDWSEGMILFIDNRGDRNYHAGDKLLHSWRWDKHKINVVWQGFRSNHYIVFANDPSQSSASGRFKISQFGQTRGEDLIVNRFGRIRAVGTV